MKSTELSKAIKELTGASNDEAALEAIEAALARRQPQQSFGVLLTVDPELSGQYWPHLFGGPRLSLEQMQVLQGACRHFAEESLGQIVRQAERRRIEAEVRAELGFLK